MGTLRIEAVFREGHEDACDVSCQSALLNNLPYLVGWIWKLLIELYAFKLTVGFQQQPAHLPSSWLIM
jgi:hypothetical protein